MAIETTKPANTLSNTCPATMLAASRRDRLTGLAKYANNSITTINGASHQGVPFGKNNEKKCRPCKYIPKNVMNKNMVIAMAKVIEI